MLQGDPFFSNDLEGFLKVGGMIVAIVGAIWAFMWRVLQGPLTQADTKLSEDIDKLKENYEKVTTSCTQNGTAIQKLEGRVEQHDNQIIDLNTKVGSITEKMDNLSREALTHKLEIIDSFQKKGNEITEMVHKLDKAVHGMIEVYNDRKERGA